MKRNQIQNVRSASSPTLELTISGDKKNKRKKRVTKTGHHRVKSCSHMPEHSTPHRYQTRTHRKRRRKVEKTGKKTCGKHKHPPNTSRVANQTG